MKSIKHILTCVIWLLTVHVQSQNIETVIQRGHTEPIKAIAFSNDGNYLLTGSSDQSIMLWDIKSGREVRQFFGHRGAVMEIDVLPHSNQFISVSTDGSAKLWNMESSKALKTFKLNNKVMLDVDVAADGEKFVVSGYDFNAYIWNMESNDTIQSIKVDPDMSRGTGAHVSFSYDDKYLITGNDNKTLNIFNLATGEKIQSYEPKNSFCGGCGTLVKAGKLGDFILVAQNSGYFTLLDLATGTSSTLISEEKNYASIDINNEESQVLALTEDSLFVYNTNAKKRLYGIALEQKQPATAAKFSPDGGYIAVSSDDKTISLYSAIDGKRIKYFGGYWVNHDTGGLEYDPNSYWDRYIRKYTTLKNDFAISPDGKYLVKGKNGAVAKMWNMKSGVLETEFVGHSKAILATVFSPDGSKLITGSADRTIKVWDVKTGKLLNTLEGHVEVIFDLAVSPSGDQLLSGSWDGTAKLWDLNSFKLIKSIRFPQASPYKLTFFKGDLYAMIACLDKTLKLVELDSEQPAKTYVGHTDVIHNFDLNASGGLMASVSWEGSLKIWDINSELIKWKFNQSSPLYAVAISNDGKNIVVGGEDRLLRMFDATTGALLGVLEGHQASITNIKFTPDDKYLISSSVDGVLNIWNTDDNKPLLSYLMLDNKEWLAISPEGYFNGTPTAFDKVAFVKGLKSYSVDQFYKKFYAPNLVESVFEKSRSQGSLIEEKIKKSPPPSVEILVPHSGEKLNRPKTNLYIRVTDNGGGVKDLKLEHNGKLINLEGVKTKRNTYVQEVDVQLVTGKNTFSAYAYSHELIQSDKSYVTIVNEYEKQPELYILSLGINEYEEKANELNYAVNDADDFSAALASKSTSLFKAVHAIPMRNKQVNKQRLVKQLDSLALVIEPEDVFVFYYAGHGNLENNQFCLIPTEGAAGAIHIEEVVQELVKIKALKQVIVMDACHSGAAAENVSKSLAVKAQSIAIASHNSGVHILASASGDQSASELVEFKHGLFTHVILEAIEGKADGAPNDGKITVFELKSYLDELVPKYSEEYLGFPQYPFTYSQGNNFPLLLD